MPEEHYIGRLCAEFGRLPTEMFAEIARLPAGYLDRLVECRRYAEAKAAYDRAETPEQRAALRGHPLCALAERIQFWIEGILEEV